MMSSEQEYETPATLVHRQRNPFEYEEIVFKDQAKPDTHLYHTLEPHKDTKFQQTLTKFERSTPKEADSHLHRTSQSVSETKIEARAHDSRLASTEWEGLSQQDADPHLYHTLEPPRDDYYASDAELTPAEFRHKDITKSDTHVYQALTQPTEANTEIYINKSQLQTPRLTLKEAYHDYRSKENTTLEGNPAEIKVSQKKGKPLLHIALICSGMLVLIAVTAIAIAALVLALKKPPGPCQCGEDIILGLLNRIATLETSIADIETIANNNSYGLGVVDSLVSTNTDRIGANEQNISTNTQELGFVSDATAGINTALARDVGNLATTVKNLETRVRNSTIRQSCNTSIEANCTIPLVAGQCTTAAVEYQKPDQLTIAFTCVTENALTATALLNGTTIMCQCNATSLNIIRRGPMNCGLSVTRCT